MGGLMMNFSGSGQGQVASACECVNDPVDNFTEDFLM